MIFTINEVNTLLWKENQNNLRNFYVKVFTLILTVTVDVVLSASLNINRGQSAVLDPLGYPYSSETSDSFLGEDETSLKTISKRSSDWSSRKSSVSKLEPQGSDIVEVTTKFPRVIRKVKLQKVLLQDRQIEQNGFTTERNNDTLRSNKRGRIVRIKKLKRRKTVKPISTTSPPTTTIATTTITTNRPSKYKPITPPTEYSHITVINKEFRDQKPNRKRKPSKTKLWVPSAMFDGKETKKEINDITPQPDIIGNEVKRQDLETNFSHIPNKFKVNNNGIKLDIYRTPRSRSNNSSRQLNQGHIPNSNTRRNDPYKPKGILEENTKESQFNQTEITKSLQTETEGKTKSDLHQIEVQQSISKTTQMPAVPKSIEILSDKLPDQTNPLSNNTSQANSKNSRQMDAVTEKPLELFSDEISSPFQTNSEPGQVNQNNQFDLFPPQRNPIFQGYPYEDINPFFRDQQPQFQRRPFNQNSNPNFPQHFPPFYRQNERPDVYSSPQLASLRRSVIDAYTEEEEPTETTTEFSIPKFEIPSIDFNDKGCRTVYKEVSEVPSDGFSKRKESKAKSFVMTRECYFPDGVPTVKSTNVKEETSVTPPTTEKEK
ncbi:uncharacterized protein CDAR_197151 [Caerostris darwini]|uniref:Uncharacterized protein n=1 Tax=Caerostris darwini TaxID=1538125 RepID=A0AAV4M6K1_9ARAC|nr:uncharacterized protein CDAR_197151 [Caerostris darwini]